MTYRTTTTLAAAAALIAGLHGSAQAAAGPVSLTDASSTYTQDFDTLVRTGSGLYTQGSTLQGWYLPASTYSASNGSASATGTYSFGATGATDRALGSISANATSGGTGLVRFLFAITNDSGSDLSAFSLTYESEVWRNEGSATADTMYVRYLIGGSAKPGLSDVFTLTSAAFTATAPVVVGGAAATNGNSSAWRQAALGGTVTLANPWANGRTLWLEWNDDAGIGATPKNKGMAIDNVSLSFTAATAPVPEPTTNALLLAGLAALGFVARRRGRR